MDWNEVRTDALEEFRDSFLSDPEALHEDNIFTIADSNVPVYTSNLLSVVASSAHLWSREPEIGHGTAGKNLVGYAQAIVYEALSEALHEELRRLQDLYEQFRHERDIAREDLADHLDPTSVFGERDPEVKDLRRRIDMTFREYYTDNA